MNQVILSIYDNCQWYSFLEVIIPMKSFRLKRFKDIAFTNKIRYVIVGTTFVALLLACGTIIVYELLTFRTSTVNKLTTIAEIIGTSTTPAVFFNDRIYAEEMLQILRVEKYISAAFIYKEDGSVFASYHQNQVERDTFIPPFQNKGHRFAGDRLFLFHSIFFDEEMLGTVCIVYELIELRSRLIQYASTIVLVLIASFAISFIIASRLQKLIVKPIVNLAQVASTVTKEKNYSIRAETPGSEDELGSLVIDFNKMLARIETRDRDLEKLVSERTKKLWEAVRELRKLDEMKTDFFTSISHELRTPLTSVLGFTKIIRKRFEEKIVPYLQGGDTQLQTSREQIIQDLDIILSEGNRLKTMINNILELAKLEEGAVIWKMEPLKIHEIIELAAAATHPIVREKGLALHIESEDGFPSIVGDKDRLTQVMVNLIANAVKYTNGGTITCRSKITDQWVVISVIDTGKGVTQDECGKLFDKFHQAEQPDGNNPDQRNRTRTDNL